MYFDTLSKFEENTVTLNNIGNKNRILSNIVFFFFSILSLILNYF